MDNFFSKAYADTLYVGYVATAAIDMDGNNITNVFSIDTDELTINGLAAATESFVSSGYQPLDADLTALAALTGTNTIYYRSAANTWSPVTIGTNLTFSGGTLSASGGSGDALTSNPLSQFAATTSAQLRGVISDETGSGSLVFATSPTLTTPELGVATATSIQTSGISSFDKTRTSSTNFETFTIDPTTDASNYRLGSRVGSAGGTTRGIVFGSYSSAGSWSSLVTIATNGDVTATQFIGKFYQAQTLLTAVDATTNGIALGSGKRLSWSSTVESFGTTDLAIGRVSSGVMAIYAGSATSNTTLASLNLSNLTASGTIVNTPSSSVTLSTNGQFSVEITSNTAGNLVYRGSDGTTRRFAFTLS